VTTHVLTFRQPAVRLSLNDRKLHWARKAAITKLWRQAAWAAAICHRTPFDHQPSFVRVTFPVRDNRRRDNDNPSPTVKACVDGLVDAGYWPDDSPEWVETLGSRFAKGAEQVVVEIIPRSEGIA
jgi:crossover junction endodeoxyribonuclease RusA